MDRVAYHLFDVCAYAIRTMPECVSVYHPIVVGATAGDSNRLLIESIASNNGFINQSVTRSPTLPRARHGTVRAHIA